MCTFRTQTTCILVKLPLLLNFAFFYSSIVSIPRHGDSRVAPDLIVAQPSEVLPTVPCLNRF